MKKTESIRPLKDCSFDELKDIYSSILNIYETEYDWLNKDNSTELPCSFLDAMVVRASFMCMVKLCMEKGIPLPEKLNQVYGLDGQMTYEDFFFSGMKSDFEYDFFEADTDMIIQHTSFCDLSGIGDFAEDTLDFCELAEIVSGRSEGNEEEDELEEDDASAADDEDAECDFTDYAYMHPQTKAIVSVLATNCCGDDSSYHVESCTIRTSVRLGRILLEKIPNYPKDSLLVDMFNAFSNSLGCGTAFYSDEFNHVSLDKELGFQSITSIGYYEWQGSTNTEFYNIFALRPLAYVIDELMYRIEDGTVDANPDIYLAIQEESVA